MPNSSSPTSVTSPAWIAIRTRTAVPPGQGSAARARWASTAAATASPAEPKMKTQPSQPVGYPLPPWAPAAPVRSARCRSMTETKVSPSDPSRRVDPSTSVKSSATMSVKSSATIRGSCILGARAPHGIEHAFASAIKSSRPRHSRVAWNSRDPPPRPPARRVRCRARPRSPGTLREWLEPRPPPRHNPIGTGVGEAVRARSD
jgi:hypothetical protein